MRAGLGGSRGGAAPPAVGVGGGGAPPFANVLASRQAKALKKGCAVLVVVINITVQ